MDAVNQLGVDKAVPKRILDLMNVAGLTRENVASHLQVRGRAVVAVAVVWRWLLGVCTWHVGAVMPSSCTVLRGSYPATLRLPRVSGCHRLTDGRVPSASL